MDTSFGKVEDGARFSTDKHTFLKLTRKNAWCIERGCLQNFYREQLVKVTHVLRKLP